MLRLFLAEAVVILTGHIKKICGVDRATRKEAMKLVLDYIKEEELNDVEDGVNIVYSEFRLGLV